MVISAPVSPHCTLHTKPLQPSETQPAKWKALEQLHGSETASVVLDDLCKAMDSRGSLDVLRHGFKCFGKQLDAAYFKPAHGLNPDTLRLYDANRLTVTRQLRYSTKNENSIDVVLSLNGIPFATAELKNPLSGQNVNHARHQYCHDRDPRELIFQFKKRTLVHFAVDPDFVLMTAQLKGKETLFLPFNKGNNRGAGNPDNPGGHRTAYLWEEIWQRDSILDILARFLHLEIKERRFNGKTVKKESMIFPRYHQLDCVRQLERCARKSGPGHNYLIQHSAGSGKSNSIGWLAHRLAFLHTDQDQKVFDSVVVITDRVVLDQQLQETIYQFEHTEGSMNSGIADREIPKKFETDEYQILIAADKFQTGFDQPQLHTMYVDKRLAGIQAVQTLSRLNRTHSGKEDTFVLDFYNDREEVLRAFQDYYEVTSVGDQADPHQMYSLQSELNGSGVYRQEEVEEFCQVFFKPRANHTPADHGKMNAILDMAVERFKALRDELKTEVPEKEWRQAKEEAQEEFRSRLQAFRSLYSFLSQVIPYQDSDLEKLYSYARFLITKLPRVDLGVSYDFEDEVALKFYRLQKISEGAIELQSGVGGELKGPTAVGTGRSKDQEVELSTLIQLLNERFGTDFKPADQLFLDSVREDAIADEGLRQAALANTIDNFKYVFSKALEGLFIDRMEQNEEIFNRFMSDQAFQQVVEETLRNQVYERIREDQPGSTEGTKG